MISLILLVKTYTELMAMDDKTKAEMEKDKEDQTRLNEGLWLRLVWERNNF